MDVLVLTPVPPWPLRSGGAIRTFELARALPRGVRAHLWSVAGESREGESAAVAALGGAFVSVRIFARSSAPRWARVVRAKSERWFHSEELARALAAAPAQAGAFDLVHVDEPALLRALPRRLGAPLVVHHHKLDVELAAALGAPPWERTKLARLETLAARRARHHVVCSREDAARLVARHPAIRAHVVESGADPERFAPSTEPRERDRLLFLGSLAYPPNLDALEVLVRAILPRVRELRPNARVRVVGERPGERACAIARGATGVELVGELDDVRDELARASLLVAPLRIGGGTRLKIASALAQGCPVVATRIAAEGLALENGVHLALADDPHAFARATAALLAAPHHAAELAARGRARILERYGWPQLAERLHAAWCAATIDEAARARAWDDRSSA